MSRQLHPNTSSPVAGKEGVLYAVFAYTAWGLLPVYWKFFRQIPALEVLSHRIVWSMIFLIGLLVWQRRTEEFWQLGTVPWIALGLAFSFAFYGLVRKVVAVSPMVGLAVETLLATPVALALIGYATATGTGHFSTSLWLMLLLIGAGIVTSFPLLWFNNAAKRLRLSTLGFCQYIAPSLQLLLGIFLYHESFSRTHAVTFGLIWLALLTYSTTSLVKKNQ